MNKVRNLLIISFLLLVGSSGFGQNHDLLNRAEVLQKNEVGKMFIYGKWTYEGGGETHLKYLGKFSTIDGRTFKIMTSTWYWGMAKRATSRILIFNDKNQYLGNYYVDMVDELPYQLDGSILKFNPTNCGEIQTFYTDFKKGLSKSIYVGCKGKNGEGIRGDFYSFNS